MSMLAAMVHTNPPHDISGDARDARDSGDSGDARDSGDSRDALREAIAAQWRPRANLDRIRADLERKGRDLSTLTLEDLAPHDQLHAGGLTAARELAAWVGVPKGARVLDMGAGLGGTARLLALEHEARVIAVDLSPELTRTGAAITAWLGLEALVRHREAELAGVDADQSDDIGHFDLIWLQHLDMHVPDKPFLYAACRRLLAPGGRVVWHDWLAGPGGPCRFPVPWSADGVISFLADEASWRAILAGAGLTLTRFQPIPLRTDRWYETLEGALRKKLARLAEAGRPALPHLPPLLEEVTTLRRNLAEERVMPIFAEAR